MLLNYILFGEIKFNFSNRSDIDEKGLIRRVGEFVEEV